MLTVVATKSAPNAAHDACRAAGVVVLCCSPTGVSWKTTGGENTAGGCTGARCGSLAVGADSKTTYQQPLSHSFFWPPGKNSWSDASNALACTCAFFAPAFFYLSLGCAGG